MMTTEMINKINRILAGLTNCQLEFTPIDSVDEREWNRDELKRLDSDSMGAPRFVTAESGASIGFPVRTGVGGSLSGLAVIKGLSSNNPGEEIAALAEVMSAVIGSRMSDDRDDRQNLEDRLNLQLQIETQPSKVTPIRPSRLTRVRELRRALESAEDQRPVVSANNPLLIDSDSLVSIARTAFEIHERSGRWAFLSLHDLSADTLETRENLKALGSITLFINDLSALNTHQQIRLAEYLATQPTNEMPHVIAGITSEEKRRSILPLLLGYFTIARRPETSSTPRQVADAVESLASPQGHLIPFDLRLLDPDQAPVH